MPRMSGVQTGHQGPKVRLTEPERQLLSQNTAFAGDHEHELYTLCLGSGEEMQQCAIRRFLCHSVKVDPRFGFQTPTAEMRVGMTANGRRGLFMKLRFGGEMVMSHDNA